MASSNCNKNLIKPVHVCVPDEEEDEEIAAHPKAEDSQEDKDEHGEQQEEGKDRSFLTLEPP